MRESEYELNKQQRIKESLELKKLRSERDFGPFDSKKRNLKDLEANLDIKNK